MSDPIAVSILAKLSAWYAFDGDLTDSHGSYDMSPFAGGTSYSTGLKGQQLNSPTSVRHAFGTALTMLPNAGNYTVGGWFNYVSGSAARPEFGLSFATALGGEALTIVVNPAGFFYLQTFIANSVDDPVSDPLSGAANYPVRISADDSAAQTAYSDQVIRIATGGTLLPGRYFVVGTWDEGARILYVDSINVASKPAPATLKSDEIIRISVGRDANLSVTDLDECFVCLDGTLTAEEVSWLYNSGNGRSYADVVAAAA